MNVSIQLDCEQISRLVYDDLLETREAFLADMEADAPCIFSCNEVYDKMLIQKHIDALDVILEWYRDPRA
jgi:hypothetical protein